ncbi:MAG: FAD-binding oxidoreductase [Chloroflexi bacterium]|nr:MAG: FAD-binding oxidoreductase [Chloroflexota bacterium]
MGAESRLAQAGGSGALRFTGQQPDLGSVRGLIRRVRQAPDRRLLRIRRHRRSLPRQLAGPAVTLVGVPVAPRGHEVGIIGAGIHGASAAFHLAARWGIKAAIFEQFAAAGGPTGRSSAICRAYYTNRYLARIAHASLDMFRAFGELTVGRDCGYRQTGIVYLHDGADAAALREAARYMNSIGTRIEVLGPEDIAGAFPLFAPEGIGVAGWEPDAGYADPVTTTAGLLARAGELGAEQRLYTRVTGLDERPGGGARLHLVGGETAECERLLIAAGPWTKALAAMLGADLPLTVERHYVATIRWSHAREMRYAHADIPGGYYCKPEGDDLYCLGPLTPEPEVDPDEPVRALDDEESHQLASLATTRIPRWKDAVSTGGWASLYDVSPDWMPVIGEIAPGVFVDAGTSGHGFKLAPALGAEVAALLIGDEVDAGIREFTPDRFGSGRQLAAGYGQAKILG